MMLHVITLGSQVCLCKVIGMILLLFASKTDDTVCSIISQL